MRIVRVFPYKTSFTPDDEYVRIGFPDLISCQLPPHDEIHVSITFTWDRELGKELQRYWQEFTDKPVKLGGGGLRISGRRLCARDVLKA